jgi:hypothetical protein
MSTPQTSTPPNQPSGGFVSIITTHKSGDTAAKIDDVIREVVKAVNATQLKGSVTVKLGIVPNGVGVGDTPLFKIVPKISKSIPEKPEQGQAYFADENNNLSQRNPNQGEMKLRIVHGGKDGATTESAPSGKAANQ